NGVGSLIDALREKVNIVPARVESIAMEGDEAAAWRVHAGNEAHFFDCLVLCCGANCAAPLVAPIDPWASELLASIPYTGSAIWTLAYRREDVPHPLDAFGF